MWQNGALGQACKGGGKARVQEVQEEEGTDFFLEGHITCDNVNNGHGKSKWTADLMVCGEPHRFSVDTGADVSIIPKPVYDAKFAHITHRKADKVLRGPDRKPLKVLGCFRGKLVKGDLSITEDIYVLNSGSSLLSRDSCDRLGVVKLIGEIASNPSVDSEFSSMFEGLGKLDGEYHITLKENAIPYNIPTPRRVPIPLLPKVKGELDKLENLDVIEKVEEPSDWCAPMCVVTKPNGQVRICVDLTKLNNAVKRERIMLPTVDYTIARMGGAKFFSKLDLNMGFHQICLDKESRELCTFITPYGPVSYYTSPSPRDS